MLRKAHMLNEHPLTSSVGAYPYGRDGRAADGRLELAVSGQAAFGRRLENADVGRETRNDRF